MYTTVNGNIPSIGSKKIYLLDILNILIARLLNFKFFILIYNISNYVNYILKITMVHLFSYSAIWKLFEMLLDIIRNRLVLV